MKLVQLNEFESKHLPMGLSEKIISGISDCISLKLGIEFMCDNCLKKSSRTRFIREKNDRDTQSINAISLGTHLISLVQGKNIKIGTCGIDMCYSIVRDQIYSKKRDIMKMKLLVMHLLNRLKPED